MSVGYGIGAGVGFAKETTYGTPVSPALFLPFLSESLAGTRPVVASGTITGDRSVHKNLPGVRSGSGDVSFEVDGSNLGMPLWFANSNASGGYAAAAIPGRLSAAPTVTVNAGGTIPVGTYRIRAQSVWQRVDMAGSGEPGEFYYLPATAELQAEATSGNQTFDLQVADPSALTPPTGFAYYGTAWLISPVGGASQSEQFLKFVLGTTATYNHTGADTIQSGAAAVFVASVYQHTYVKAYTPGSNPLPGFTTTIVKDNDRSQQFMGCRSNGLELSWGKGDSPVQGKWAIMARDFRDIANPTISITNLRKMMAWAATVSIDGTFDERIEALTVNLANGGELIDGFSGIPRRRNVGYGQRVISGTLGRGFEDHYFWQKMRAAERFSLRCLTVGAPLSETLGAIPLDAGKVAYPLPYFMTVEAFGCMLDGAGASASGFGRMVESLPFKCEVDPTAGTDLRVRLYNLTADYAA